MSVRLTQDIQWAVPHRIQVRVHLESARRPSRARRL